MSSERPLGIDCQDWKAFEPGKKRCSLYITANPALGEVAAMCNLTKNFLCTEWEKANPTIIDSARLAARQKTGPSTSSSASKPASPSPTAPHVQADLFAPATPPPPPPSPPVSAPPEPQGTVPIGFAPPVEQPRPTPPRPMVPVKEIPADDVKALEDLGAELCLSSKILNRDVWLVPKKTNTPDRFEMTFQEAATLRLIVDAFPGVRVTQLITAAEVAERSPK